jgi:hypothetical protein
MQLSLDFFTILISLFGDGGGRSQEQSQNDSLQGR